MGFAGYDTWKLRSDLDEFPPQEEPPVENDDELQFVYQELADLKAAILKASCHQEEDADFDGERYVDQSTFHLTFSRRAFDELLEALGIESKAMQSDLEAFKEASELLDASLKRDLEEEIE